MKYELHTGTSDADHLYNRISSGKNSEVFQWFISIKNQYFSLYHAGGVGVVVSSLALHRSDPGSIPRSGIQAVRIHA